MASWIEINELALYPATITTPTGSVTVLTAAPGAPYEITDRAGAAADIYDAPAGNVIPEVDRRTSATGEIDGWLDEDEGPWIVTFFPGEANERRVYVGSVGPSVASHANDTANVHGIADTAALVVTSDPRLADTIPVEKHGGSPAASPAANAAAINAAAAEAVAAGGGIVSFRAGTYSYTAPLTFDALSNVMFVGAGRGATLLRPTVGIARWLYFTNAANVELRDLSIGLAAYPAEISDAAVEFAGGARVGVRDCEAFNCPNIGLAFNGCTFAHAVGNHIHDCRRDGLHFVNCDQSLVCRDNHIEGTADDGIALWAYSDAESDAMYGAIVSGNLVEECSPGAGIVLGGSTGVAVIGNTTRRTRAPGIRVGKQAAFSTKGCRRVAVANNIVISPSAFGIAGGWGGIEVGELDAAGVRTGAGLANEDITITGNAVYNAGNQGYDLWSTKGLTVVGNISADSNANNGVFSAAVWVIAVQSFSFVGNVLVERRGVPRSVDAVYVDYSSDGIVTGNAMRGMSNPNFVVGANNTSVSVIANEDGDNLARQASPPSYDTAIELRELTADPPAPAANRVRYYAKDNGAGKTQLCVRFNTGAVQVLATQP